MSLLIHFLTQIRSFVRAQDGDNLRAWLQVGPQSSSQYYQLQDELNTPERKRDLAALLNECLPIDDDVEDGQATVWPGFIAFVTDYLVFWRDVNFDDLPAAHQLLSGLAKYVFHLPSLHYFY